MPHHDDHDPDCGIHTRGICDCGQWDALWTRQPPDIVKPVSTMSPRDMAIARFWYAEGRKDALSEYGIDG